MIRSWKRRWLAGVAGLLIAQAGCVAPEIFGLSGFVKDTQSTRSGNNGLPPSQAAKACLEVAVSFDKKGNDFNAIEQYEKVLQIEPKNKEAMRRLTVLYDHLGEFAKAGAYYEKLEKLTPRDANLFNDWGYSCFLQNKYAEAEKHLRHALELKPDHVKARSNLGMALGQQERYQEAFKAFRDAKLSEADAHCDLGYVYCCKGKFDDARREYTLASKLDPGCSKAKELLTLIDQPSRRLQAEAAARAARDARTRGQTLPAGGTDILPVSSTTVRQSVAGDQPVLRAGGVNWMPVDYGAMKPAAE